MKSILVCVVAFCVISIESLPISQPIVQNPYIQQVQPIQFAHGLQQPQVQYIQQQLLQPTPAEIYQGLSHRQSTPPPPPPPPSNPPSQITQLLLPSAADRQVQQAASYVAGPGYAKQVQSLQLQGLADQAQAIALRRAQLTNIRLRQLQPQYQQQLAPQTKPGAHQLQAVESDDRQLPEDYDPNPSYQFGFDVKDDYYTNYQNRKEQRNGNKISGSYSVVDADGFLRTVTYTADPKEGFKAEVNRQPTNIVIKIPKPTLSPKQQYLQDANDAPIPAPKQRLLYQYQ